jgi:alpha-tubulin suppressor-like RCC1 family protein
MLFSDGTFSVSGDNREGQCDSELVLTTNHNQNVNLIATRLSYKNLQTKAVQVSCGNLHTAVLFSNGAIALLGNNANGQCAAGNLRNDLKAVRVACGAAHTVVLYENGLVMAVGDNFSGQCNVDAFNPGSSGTMQMHQMHPPASIANISCGQKHTAVL